MIEALCKWARTADQRICTLWSAVRHLQLKQHKRLQSKRNGGFTQILANPAAFASPAAARHRRVSAVVVPLGGGGGLPLISAGATEHRLGSAAVFPLNTPFIPIDTGIKKESTITFFPITAAPEAAAGLRRRLVTATVTPVFATNPGTIQMYGGSSAPSGWLLCNGAAVSQTTYADLFAVIGTTFGPATGGNFTLPNMTGRVPVGPDPSGLVLPLLAPSLGQSGGNEDVTLSAAQSGLPAHGHGITDPGHHHVPNIGTSFLNGNSGGSYNLVSAAGSYWGETGQTAPISTGIAVNSASPVGASASHNNVQPFQAINFIIKT